jgi:hypothetical protein
MNMEDKCYEVTYEVKCRIWNVPHIVNVDELAKEMKDYFKKGNISIHSAGGNIETFQGKVVNTKQLELKHPYHGG